MRVSAVARARHALGALALALWPAVGAAHEGLVAQHGWSSAPLHAALALFAMAWITYLAGAWRRPPLLPAGIALHSAMLITGFALFGPLDEWSAQSEAWHMVQHMTLLHLTAPLLVVARPWVQWRAALGPRGDRLWSMLHRWTRHPGVCSGVQAAAIWFWHLPGPYRMAVDVPGWHVVEHSCFLFSAWLFWGSVLRPSHKALGGAVGALLFTLMHTGMLGALLVFTPMPLYNPGSASLAGQQLAGALMWVPGGVVYLVALARVGQRWLRLVDPPGVTGPVGE